MKRQLSCKYFLNSHWLCKFILMKKGWLMMIYYDDHDICKYKLTSFSVHSSICTMTHYLSEPWFQILVGMAYVERYLLVWVRTVLYHYGLVLVDMYFFSWNWMVGLGMLPGTISNKYISKISIQILYLLPLLYSSLIWCFSDVFKYLLLKNF